MILIFIMLKLGQILQKFVNIKFIMRRYLSSKTSFGAQQSRYDLIQNFKRRKFIKCEF